MLALRLLGPGCLPHPVLDGRDGKAGHSFKAEAMTKLTVAIRREVDLYGVGPVVVGLEPTTKSFIFREKGCRTEYCIPILTVFVLAIKLKDKKQ
jgi:hypothetical protein